MVRDAKKVEKHCSSTIDYQVMELVSDAKLTAKCIIFKIYLYTGSKRVNTFLTDVQIHSYFLAVGCLPVYGCIHTSNHMPTVTSQSTNSCLDSRMPEVAQ